MYSRGFRVESQSQRTVGNFEDCLGPYMGLVLIDLKREKIDA